MAEAGETAVSRYFDSLKKATVIGEPTVQFPDQAVGLTHLVKILRRNLVLAPAAPIALLRSNVPQVNREVGE